MSGADGEILVIAPHATRTGSTKVLIELLARVPGELASRISIRTLTGGPWLPRLQALGSTPSGRSPAAVLINSALAAGEVPAASSGIPAAVYVHETGAVLATLGEAALEGLRRAHLVLCVSGEVQLAVVAVGVAPTSTMVLPPVLTIGEVDERARAEAREHLGVGPGERLVLGCGEASFRKGTDLFVELAGYLVRRPDVRFAWVGRRLRPFDRQLDLDVSLAGLDDRLVWVGETDDVGPYLAAADVLVMSSRHDPQPLVPLEAAMLGTPTAALERDGLAELGADGAALTAVYPDVPALAAHVSTLLDDRRSTDRVVAKARERIDANQAPEVIVPVFVDALRTLLTTCPSPEPLPRPEQ